MCHDLREASGSGFVRTHNISRLTLIGILYKSFKKIFSPAVHHCQVVLCFFFEGKLLLILLAVFVVTPHPQREAEEHNEANTKSKINNNSCSCSCCYYYMAESTSRQDEANPAF